MSPRPHSSNKALFIWSIAVVAYAVAVAQRSSFGVSGLQAADRFAVQATALSLFAVVQVLVYAGAQVPVGLLLDRWGSRLMIGIGAAVMAVGQLVMALAPSIGLALVARVLIGAGDAMTYVSLLRLVPAWFSPRQVPLITQLSGILGQIGQIFSALPFAAFLRAAGWTPAYSLLAVIGLMAAAATALWVRDRPTQSRVQGPDMEAMVVEPLRVRTSLRLAVTNPGTWLGFWTHLTTGFSMNVFALMWGVPFLVAGQGRTSQEAGWLLTLSVLVGIVAGPVVGEFTARHPLRRSWAVLLAGCAVGIGWALVLVPDTPRPLWVLALFVLLISVGGPASAVGFDFARTTSPTSVLGLSTGVVNMGGFVAAVVGMLGVGILLDLRAPSGIYTLADYRVAMSFLAVPWLVGLVGILVTRRSTRAEMATQGIMVPPLSEAWRRWRSERDD